MRKVNPRQVGDIAETEVLAALLKLGYEVVKPCNSGSRWDIGVVAGTRLVRLQIKNANLDNGVVLLPTCNSRNGFNHAYCGDCELIAAYCLGTDQCYAIRPEDAGKKSVSLRIRPAAHGQIALIRKAEDFHLDAVLASMIAPFEGCRATANNRRLAAIG